jgi:hypothetical protein
MAGVKVTDLNTLGTAAANDVFYIVDTASNESKQIEVGNVVNLQTAWDNGSTINGADVVIEEPGLGVGIGAEVLSGATGQGNIAFGNKALKDSTGDESVCLGKSTGDGSTGSNSVIIGTESGGLNTGEDLVALGRNAGNINTGNNVIALGYGAGNQNTGLNLIAVGKGAGDNNTGDNVIALGNTAATNNTLSGMFVISNNCMPSYADATAAATAITVALGATAGDYYLYHDQSDDTIKVVIP